MKVFNSRRWWITVFSSFMLLIAVALPLVSFWIRHKVQQELDGVLKNFSGHYGNLHVSALPAMIDIRDLTFSIPMGGQKDSLHAAIAHLRLSGMSYIAWLRKRELIFDRMEMQSSMVDLDPETLADSGDKSHAGLPPSLKGVLIKDMIIRDLSVSTPGAARRLFDANVALKSLRIARRTGGFYVSNEGYRAEFSHLAYAPQGSHIALFIEHVTVGSAPPFFEADSCSVHLAGQPGGIVASAFIDHLKAGGQLKQAAAAISLDELDAGRLTVQIKEQAYSWDNIRSQLSSALPAFDAHFLIRTFIVRAVVLHGNLNGQELNLHADAKLTELNIAIDRHRITCRPPALHMNLRNASCVAANRQYSLSLQGGVLDSKSKQLDLRMLELIPLYSKIQLGRAIGHQTDWMRATVHNIRLSGIDFEALLRHNLTAERLYVGSSIISVFRDRRLPRLQAAQPLPMSQLKSLPFDINLASLQIENTSVRYEEQPMSGGPVGTLRVHLDRVSVSPLRNHVTKGGGAFLTMRMQGSLMDKGAVYAHMELPLLSSSYHVSGAIRMLDLTALNSGAENLGNLRIQSGLLDSLGFDFRFNDQRADGKIVGAYHNLVLQQLKSGARGHRKVAFFRSFVLRHLIIPLNKDQSLPEKKRTGMIRYTRDPTRNLSYFMMQSLLSGIKNSFKLGFLLPK